MIYWPYQDPAAKLEYWFDLQPAVDAEGSPLATYAIAVTGTDSALVKSGEVLNTNVVYFWLATPTEGVTYTVTCAFELNNGFKDKYSRKLLGRRR
jgi:hypothetical protein